MQAATRAQAAARAQAGADIAPPPPQAVFSVGDNGNAQVLQVPKNHEEMQALLAQRQQLSDQLEGVTDRRNDIIERMRVAPEVAMPGLRAQLTVLDQRVVQLETDLATVGREISAASPELLSMAEEPTNPPSEDAFDEGMVAGLGSMFVIMATVLLFLRRRWKKAPRTNAPLMLSGDSERLQRLEHGMEAMSIEIERISEGQRFVTKLLSESHGGSAPAQRSPQQTVLVDNDPARR
ncbi:MAG: hypothetical protein ACJ78D_11310 [Gemmatimonadaceae bacterium]